MDFIKEINALIQGKNKLKIIGLAILIVVCFGLIYMWDSSSGQSASPSYTNEETQVSRGDFASVLSSMEGAGKVNLYVTYIDENETQVQGVIIVAEGASDLNVVFMLQSAAATAYGINVDQIEVFEMKGVNYDEGDGAK